MQMKIEFSKKIYTHEVIDEAIEAFKDFSIAHDEIDEYYWKVKIPEDDCCLKGEFCNYVLGLLFEKELKNVV